METETYKNAKLILERFDPDSKKKIVSFALIAWSRFGSDVSDRTRLIAYLLLVMQELEGTPLGPPMTPRPGQGRTSE